MDFVHLDYMDDVLINETDVIDYLKYTFLHTFISVYTMFYILLWLVEISV